MSRVDWFKMSDKERNKLKDRNNPERSPVGPYTGRCSVCHSDSLWDDASTYGCNCCGAIFSNL